VADTATLIGDVVIHEQATVMFGAVVRGDRASLILGARSNLQDSVVVHADPGFDTTIGSDVSVGHGAVVHGATIGDNTLIGMNATILNGAVIGENCIIAAGSVVLEGANIPAGSLVAGTPGVVRRPTTDSEHQAIAANAATYCALGEAYRGASSSGL
jgi:carbonic anhydrase/acetyltransferase-like protein (isoleucine patch superfamily)